MAQHATWLRPSNKPPTPRPRASNPQTTSQPKPPQPNTKIPEPNTKTQTQTPNQVWLRELYRKMVQHTKDFLNAEMKQAGEAESSADVNAQAIAQRCV